MKRHLYNAIKSRTIELIPEVKTFGLFNNQISNEKKENPFTFPAIFIEFDSFSWTQSGRGIQSGKLNVRFHVAFELYTTGQTSNRIDQPDVENEFFELVAKIHRVMNGFNDEYFTPLIRSTETQQTDHGNVMVWSIDYSTQITDDGAETRYSRPLVNLIPNIISGLSLTINFPDLLTPEVEMSASYWWFTGFNPANVNLVWLFTIGTVDPDTLLLFQYNDGNGWITVDSMARSEFQNGNEYFVSITTETSISATAKARIAINGIGYSNAVVIQQD